MSENTAQPKPERSLGREIARSSTISAAANAAGVLGAVGAIVVVSKLASRFRKDASTDNDATLESETTES